MEERRKPITLSEDLIQEIDETLGIPEKRAEYIENVMHQHILEETAGESDAAELPGSRKRLFKWGLAYAAILAVPLYYLIVISFKNSADWFAENLGWMYWTVPSGLFFGAIFLAIAALGIWDEYRPNINRKGFLPIVTSRGDRLFIGIVSTIAIHLLWLLLFKMTFLWGAVILSIAWFYIEARWG